MYVYIYIYICRCFVYIYIYRERERKRERCFVYIYIYAVSIYICCVYIYIYISRGQTYNGALCVFEQESEPFAAKLLVALRTWEKWEGFSQSPIPPKWTTDYSDHGHGFLLALELPTIVGLTRIFMRPGRTIIIYMALFGAPSTLAFWLQLVKFELDPDSDFEFHIGASIQVPWNHGRNQTMNGLGVCVPLVFPAVQPPLAVEPPLWP